MNSHQLIHSGLQLVVFTTHQHFDVYDFAFLSVRQLQRGITHFLSFLAKDGANEPLFGGEVGFGLGRDFAHQYIARSHFCAQQHDALIVQIVENIVGHIRNVARYLFRANFGVASLYFVLVNVHRSKHIVTH